MSSRARRQRTRSIEAAQTGICPTCGHGVPGSNVDVHVGRELDDLMKRVLPAVAGLRADVKSLLEQVHAGRHPVSLTDELEATVSAFMRKIGQG